MGTAEPPPGEAPAIPPLAVVAEAYRLSLMRGLEDLLESVGYQRIAGVDEAGRGCLAGPVVAAAFIPRPGVVVAGVDDSKRLPRERRERLADEVRRAALAWAVIPVAADVIDRINILEATRLAMRQALAALDPAPDCVVTDAMPLADSPCPVLSLVRADGLSYAVACASILAKVERDRSMERLDRYYPQYGFAANKGYGAPDHLLALGSYGPTPEHRLTFRSVVPRLQEA